MLSMYMQYYVIQVLCYVSHYIVNVVFYVNNICLYIINIHIVLLCGYYKIYYTLILIKRNTMLNKIKENTYKLVDNEKIVNEAYAVLKTISGSSEYAKAVNTVLLDSIISRLVSREVTTNNSELLQDNSYMIVSVVNHIDNTTVQCTLGYVETNGTTQIVNGVLYT